MNFVYLVGNTESSTEVADGGLFYPIKKSAQDGYVAKFTGNGERIWGYYVGGHSNQIIYDAEFDKKNFLYLYLMTEYPFSIGSDVYQVSSYGDDETLLIKYNPSDSCYDNNEPNDSKFTPKDITTSSDTTLYGYTGIISSQADADWFRIKTQATNLKVELKELPANYDLLLSRKWSIYYSINE